MHSLKKLFTRKTSALALAGLALGLVAAAPALAQAADAPVTVGRALILKLEQGGLTMLFLLLISVAAIATALERFIHLRAKNVAPPAFARKLEALDSKAGAAQLIEAARGEKSALGQTVKVLADHRHIDAAAASELAGDVASREMRLHLLRAYPLLIAATLAPLLGLFGTVVGMIGAFEKVAAAGSMGDASILGGDIAKALITTAAGLAVAMPALALYHFFKSRTQMLSIQLEEQLGELISQWWWNGGKKEGEDDAR